MHTTLVIDLPNYENILTKKNFFFQVLFLTAVSTDITEANVKAMSEKTTLSGNRTLIRQSSSMAFSQAQDEIR